VLGPEAVVLAKEETVVAPDNDDGVIGNGIVGLRIAVRILEGIQQLAHLGINEGDAGEVAVDEAPGVRGVGGLGFGVSYDVDVGLGLPAVGGGEVVRSGRQVVGAIIALEVDLRRIVEVPILLGGIEGEVRLLEADCEKEGCPVGVVVGGIAPDLGNAGIRGNAIVIGVVLHVTGVGGGAVGPLVPVLGALGIEPAVVP
jgi:hypothetical protein